MKDEMSVMEGRGYPKGTLGRPRTHTEPRHRINVEISSRVMSDLGVVASALGYSRTEAIEEGIKLWLAQVGRMKEYQ